CVDGEDQPEDQGVLQLRPGGDWIIDHRQLSTAFECVDGTTVPITARRHVLRQQPPFEDGAARRLPLRVDAERYVLCAAPHRRRDQPATEDERRRHATNVAPCITLNL